MPIRVTRLRLKNFRNLARVDLEFGDLTILVGPNASGKSNLLDALRLISDALNSTLDNALRDRGGVQAVRRRSGGHPTNFTVAVHLDLPGPNRRAFYAFEIRAIRAASGRGGQYEVKHEKCRVWDDEGVFDVAEYEVKDGRLVKAPSAAKPEVLPDRLLLPAISGIPPFSELFDLLKGMCFYSLSPERIRDIQDPHPGDGLLRDGANSTSVLRVLMDQCKIDYNRLCGVLRHVAPGIDCVEVTAYGPKEGLVFRQDVHAQKHTWLFPAQNMSDGTLRAFGVLLALYQYPTPPLIAIEEPEATINPAVLNVLVESLLDVAQRTQVIVTTHSADLLEHKDIPLDFLRLVESSQGVGRVGRAGAVAARVIKDHLYTAGELVRMGELTMSSPNGETPVQGSLFAIPKSVVRP